MTEYKNCQIEKQKGKRDIWYNVLVNGQIVYRAATEYDAMRWIDKNI